jgi:hypothetical protein
MRAVFPPLDFGDGFLGDFEAGKALDAAFDDGGDGCIVLGGPVTGAAVGGVAYGDGDVSLFHAGSPAEFLRCIYFALERGNSMQGWRQESGIVGGWFERSCGEG